MGLFSKKGKDEKPKLAGKESVVSSNELLNEEEASTDEEEIVTELSIHPDWHLPKEDVYAYQFLNLECPPLKPNQLSLSGINIIRDSETSYQVYAFIRHSLDKTIKLEETTLVLLDENDKLLGRKKFNLDEVGELPPRSSRPWTFQFTHKDLFTKELPSEGWKLAFLLTPTNEKHRLDLEPSWKKSLTSADKKKLEELVDSLTPPKEGEVNFLGIRAKFADNGDFHVMLLIRNGSDNNVNIEQLPLRVDDANGDLVASGTFKLDKFTVKANTSKPWSFIFPKELVVKDNPDLSRWKAYAPQN